MQQQREYDVRADGNKCMKRMQCVQTANREVKRLPHFIASVCDEEEAGKSSYDDYTNIDNDEKRE